MYIFHNIKYVKHVSPMKASCWRVLKLKRSNDLADNCITVKPFSQVRPSRG